MFCELTLLGWTLLKGLKHFTIHTVMCRGGTSTSKIFHRIYENLTSPLWWLESGFVDPLDSPDQLRPCQHDGNKLFLYFWT